MKGSLDLTFCSIFVAVPNIAQSKVDEAVLEIQGINILDSRPDSYLIQINSTITTDGTLKADVDSFEGNLYLGDDDNSPPFATLLFPATNSDKHQNVNISQTVQVTDENAFEQFNVAFFQKKSLIVRIQGETKIQPKGLARKSAVTFRKVLTIDSLNLLSGTKVSSAKVDFNAEKGAPNFRGVAEVPNNSFFTVDFVRGFHLLNIMKQ
jgi:hypothetical protein